MVFPSDSLSSLTGSPELALAFRLLGLSEHQCRARGAGWGDSREKGVALEQTGAGRDQIHVCGREAQTKQDGIIG